MQWPQKDCQWKSPMIPFGIEPTTFRLVVQCLNELCHCVTPPPASRPEDRTLTDYSLLFSPLLPLFLEPIDTTSFYTFLVFALKMESSLGLDFDMMQLKPKSWIYTFLLLGFLLLQYRDSLNCNCFLSNKDFTGIIHFYLSWTEVGGTTLIWNVGNHSITL